MNKENKTKDNRVFGYDEQFNKIAKQKKIKEIET